MLCCCFSLTKNLNGAVVFLAAFAPAGLGSLVSSFRFLYFSRQFSCFVLVTPDLGFSSRR